VEGGAAAEQLERVFVQREADRILHWAAASSREPEPWRRASFVGGLTLPVTAAELEAIGDQLRAVVEPYVGRLADPSSRPADARFVRGLMAGTPLEGDSR